SGFHVGRRCVRRLLDRHVREQDCGAARYHYGLDWRLDGQIQPDRPLHEARTHQRLRGHQRQCHARLPVSKLHSGPARVGGAIDAARELAKIPKGQSVSLELLPPRKSLFERMIELFGNAEVLSQNASPGLWLARPWFERLRALALEPAWAILPSVPEVW